MKPPVDYVRISEKSRDILMRIKKRTGLEHWNEICRIAYCRSLANPTPPAQSQSTGNIALDIEWKTFAGRYHLELSSMTTMRAHKDDIDLGDKDAVAAYFRSHMERGIASLQNIKALPDLVGLKP